MSKYYGLIGYVDTQETSPGVWNEIELDPREYYGEVLSNNRRHQPNSDSTNDDISVSNRISILADPYAYNNFHKMRWIEWMDSKWIISSVEVEYPRLIISLGGLYNG